MRTINCTKSSDCSAPLCPLQKISLTHGIWYPDEEICGVRKQQSLGWIKKQKLIVKAVSSNDKYFTVEMLKSARQIRKGIEGIDPDQTLSQAAADEEAWIKLKDKRVVAGENKKVKRVVAKKKASSSVKSKKKTKKSKSDIVIPSVLYPSSKK